MVDDESWSNWKEFMETSGQLSTPNVDVLWELPFLLSSAFTPPEQSQTFIVETETMALLQKETTAPNK